jgi:hypothetical protein
MFILRLLPHAKQIIGSHQRHIRMLLTLATLFSLYTIKPSSPTCHSNEAIAGAFSEEVLMKRGELGVVGSGPLYRTVCITGGERERGILEVVTANLRRRERSRPYEVAVGRRRGNYFLKIEIEIVEAGRRGEEDEEDGSRFLLEVLPGVKTNSDVVGIAHVWFPAEVSLGPIHSRGKSIRFKLSAKRESIEGFVSFLKSIDNLHSHSLGNYFYLPLGEKILSLASFIPLLLTSSILSAFETWRRDNSFSVLSPSPFLCSVVALGLLPLNFGLSLLLIFSMVLYVALL